jgi:hypothetical protein
VIRFRERKLRRQEQSIEAVAEKSAIVNKTSFKSFSDRFREIDQVMELIYMTTISEAGTSDY